MSVSMWLLEPNNGDEWNYDDVVLENGKRNSLYWSRKMLDNDFIFEKRIPIDDKLSDMSGNTMSFIKETTKSLRYKEEQMINTVNVYEHANYTIQMMYVSDYNCFNTDQYNYFATIVNTESMQVFGPAIFFKTENGLTTNLTLDQLLCCLLNFYYVKTFRYKDSKFIEITNRNLEYDIDDMFKGYHKKFIDGWVVLSEKKEELENFKDKNNKLSDFTDLIWFKLKDYKGEVHDQIKDIHNKDDDFRGMYMDLDVDFILKKFF